MPGEEEAYSGRPPQTKIEAAWKRLFNDPLLSSARLKGQALSAAGLGEEASDGHVVLRSIYWRFYLGLLPTPTSPALFAASLESSRSSYNSLRRRFLIAPDGRWATDCSPEIPDDTSTDGSAGHIGAPLSKDDGWDPLSLHGQSPWKTWFAHQELRITIRQDVDRTFPDNPYFADQKVRKMMLTMLFLFSVMNPDVGYRQGMHELLACCLLAVDMDSIASKSIPTFSASTSNDGAIREAMYTTLDARYIEHDTFALFQEVMRGAKAFYEWRAEEGPRVKSPSAPTAPIITRCKNIHNTLLKRIDPQLWEHFELEGLEPQIWAIRWIRLIFTRELPFATAMRLWDGVFAEDSSLVILDFICIAMLLLIRNELLDADYSTLLSKVLRYPAPSKKYPFSTHTILSQALFLRNNISPAGGVQIVLQNEDLLGVQSGPRGTKNIKEEAGYPGNVPPSPARIGVQGLAQGLYERAQSSGLDRSFFSGLAKTLPDPSSAYSYLLGPSQPKDTSQFSSIPSSISPQPRSSFFSSHNIPGSFPSVHSKRPTSTPPAIVQPSQPSSTKLHRDSADSGSNISIKSLKDAERELAELRLAMVGMGKAMTSFMVQAQDGQDSNENQEGWDGLGKIRDTLLDAAGMEVDDLVDKWAWNQGLQTTKSRSETPISILNPSEDGDDYIRIDHIPSKDDGGPVPADPRPTIMIPTSSEVTPTATASSRMFQTPTLPSRGQGHAPRITEQRLDSPNPSPKPKPDTAPTAVSGFSDPLAGLTVNNGPRSSGEWTGVNKANRPL